MLAVCAVREIANAPYHAAARDAEDIAPDPDAIDELGDEITTLAAHLHAATQRLLVLIAEFDRLRGWESCGHRSCAHWLAFRTGIDLGAAREKVRAARALETLPLTSAAMAQGELSFSQVRALSRVATTGTEAELLDLARGTTTAQLERIVRGWKKRRRKDEAERDLERQESRMFSVFSDDDGMYVVKGRLTPEVGALLMRAIEAAGDALYRERPVPRAASQADRQAAQRRADAIGLLAERALAAGLGAGESKEAEVPISGTRAERYQVVVHVDAETLSSEGEGGRAELEDGTNVSAETCRRLACDTSVVRVMRGKEGSVLDVGRKTRTISPALRRALEVRDRGCRFPGCGLRFTDAHHVRHWADGGETRQANCLLICKFHHTLVHEAGWRVAWWSAGRPVFIDPRGGTHIDGAWQPPVLPEQPVETLVQENLHLGIEPHAWTAGARWRRERDIPDRVYFRALEAS